MTTTATATPTLPAVGELIDNGFTGMTVTKYTAAPGRQSAYRRAILVKGSTQMLEIIDEGNGGAPLVRPLSADGRTFYAQIGYEHEEDFAFRVLNAGSMARLRKIIVTITAAGTAPFGYASSYEDDRTYEITGPSDLSDADALDAVTGAVQPGELVWRWSKLDATWRRIA